MRNVRQVHELTRNQLLSTNFLDFIFSNKTIRRTKLYSLWEVASATDASTELETMSNIDFLRVNCSTNVKFQNLKFVERLWRSDCPPLRFEKIIDLLFSSVLPHGVSWYDACEVSPPVVVVSYKVKIYVILVKKVMRVDCQIFQSAKLHY